MKSKIVWLLIIITATNLRMQKTSIAYAQTSPCEHLLMVGDGSEYKECVEKNKKLNQSAPKINSTPEEIQRSLDEMQKQRIEAEEANKRPIPSSLPSAGAGGIGEYVPTPFGYIPTSPDGFLTKVIEILIYGAGIYCFYQIMVGGYGIMTSQGNPEALNKGRKKVTQAVMGILFILLSGVILRIIAGIIGIPIV